MEFAPWMWSFWNVLKMQLALFGLCSFWNVLFLESAQHVMCPSGKWSKWNVPILECALFRMWPKGNMIKTKCALFGMCSFRNGRDSVKPNKNNTLAVMGSASHLFLPAFGWLSSGLVWQAELAVGGKERCWRPPTWPPLHKVRPELSVVCKDCYSVLVESKSERGAAQFRARVPSNFTAVRAALVTLVHMMVQRFCGRAFQ